MYRPSSFCSSSKHLIYIPNRSHSNLPVTWTNFFICFLLFCWVPPRPLQLLIVSPRQRTLLTFLYVNNCTQVQWKLHKITFQTHAKKKNINARLDFSLYISTRDEEARLIKAQIHISLKDHHFVFLPAILNPIFSSYSISVHFLSSGFHNAYL